LQQLDEAFGDLDLFIGLDLRNWLKWRVARQYFQTAARTLDALPCPIYT